MQALAEDTCSRTCAKACPRGRDHRRLRRAKSCRSGSSPRSASGNDVMNPKRYDVLVVGAGHAGCEAALAAARMGRQALVTPQRDAVARMSCNPAIGGLAKGHWSPRSTRSAERWARRRRCGIQFRLLNRSRGPAVRGPRAQQDKDAYHRAMLPQCSQAGLDLVEGEGRGARRSRTARPRGRRRRAHDCLAEAGDRDRGNVPARPDARRAEARPAGASGKPPSQLCRQPAPRSASDGALQDRHAAAPDGRTRRLRAVSSEQPGDPPDVLLRLTHRDARCRRSSCQIA